MYVPRNGNEEMVAYLKRRGSLVCPRVEEAFVRCPRGEFVPPARVAQAYVNFPLRLLDLKFTISAPEVYASALENLDIQEGNRFLDVGSGCGLLTCMAAYLAGPKGCAVGIDLTDEIVTLARSNVAKLQASSARSQDDNSFAARMPQAGVIFDNCNAFVLDTDDYATASDPDGRFDRIHCGATCPEKHLSGLIALLRPGGILVTPCGESMLVLTRSPDPASTEVSRRVALQVRYGDLIIPTEREIFSVKYNRAVRQRTLLPVPNCPAAPDDGEEDTRSLFMSQRHSDISILLEEGYAIPAHKNILARHSGHFRALFASGMCDADTATVSVPKEFDKDVFLEFLRFVYTREADVTVYNAVAALQIGKFYDAPDDFFYKCECVIRQELQVNNAAEILKIAAKFACPRLEECVNAFIVQNFEQVRGSDGWQLLETQEVERLLEESVKRGEILQRLMEAPAYKIVG